MDNETLKEELEQAVKAAVNRKIAASILFNRDYQQYPPSGIYNYYVDEHVVKMKSASGHELDSMIKATLDVLKKHGLKTTIEKEENSAARYFSRAHIYFE